MFTFTMMSYKHYYFFHDPYWHMITAKNPRHELPFQAHKKFKTHFVYTTSRRAFPHYLRAVDSLSSLKKNKTKRTLQIVDALTYGRYCNWELGSGTMLRTKWLRRFCVWFTQVSSPVVCGSTQEVMLEGENTLGMQISWVVSWLPCKSSHQEYASVWLSREKSFF